MRILILNWRDALHPKAGGAEVFTEQIARGWTKAGHDVTWFCASPTGQPKEAELDGIRVVRRGGRFTVYREARRFYSSHDPGHFDLIVDEVNTRPFLTPKWVSGTPIVALIHQVCREIWWREAPLPVAALGRFWLERRWLSAYRDVRVVTPSESSRDSLLRYGLRDVSVVRPGAPRVPLASASRDREQSPTIAFVGRLSSNKRPGHALRAFRKLKASVPGAQLWFLGDGPKRAELERRAGEGVTFFGRVSEQEKYRLLGRAHALVVTSVREGWGLVVDEAAAAGLPTIGYDIAGLRDSVPAARGELVAPHPSALAAVLVRRLPELAAMPPQAGWRGGAIDWATTAEAMLARARPTSAQSAPPLVGRQSQTAMADANATTIEHR